MSDTVNGQGIYSYSGKIATGSNLQALARLIKEKLMGENGSVILAKWLPGYVDDVLEINGIKSDAITIETGSCANPVAIYYSSADSKFVVADEGGKFYSSWTAAGDISNMAHYGAVSENGVVPVAGKIYVDIVEEKTYRWSGTSLSVIGGKNTDLSEVNAAISRIDGEIDQLEKDYQAADEAAKEYVDGQIAAILAILNDQPGEGEEEGTPGLVSRLTAAEAAIQTLQGDLLKLQGDHAALQEQVDDLSGVVTEQGEAIATNTQTIQEHDTAINEIKAALGTDGEGGEGSGTSILDRVQTLENTMGDVNTGEDGANTVGVQLETLANQVAALSLGAKASITTKVNGTTTSYIHAGEATDVEVIASVSNITADSITISSGKDQLTSSNNVTSAEYTDEDLVLASTGKKVYKNTSIYKGMELNSSITVIAYNPIYMGFAKDFDSLTVASNKQAASNTSRKTYPTVTSAANDVYWFLAVPSDVTKPSSTGHFYDGVTPMGVDELEGEFKVGDVSYTVYRGTIYDSGASLTVKVA